MRAALTACSTGDGFLRFSKPEWLILKKKSGPPYNLVSCRSWEIIPMVLSCFSRFGVEVEFLSYHEVKYHINKWGKWKAHVQGRWGTGESKRNQLPPQTFIIGSPTSPFPRRRWECQPCIARAAASLLALPDPEACCTPGCIKEVSSGS